MPSQWPAYLFVPGELRFETVDLTKRLLIPIIVLQNHNRYNIMEKGHNYSIDIEAIEAEVSYLSGMASLYLLMLVKFGFSPFFLSHYLE